MPHNARECTRPMANERANLIEQESDDKDEIPQEYILWGGVLLNILLYM